MWCQACEKKRVESENIGLVKDFKMNKSEKFHNIYSKCTGNEKLIDGSIRPRTSRRIREEKRYQELDGTIKLNRALKSTKPKPCHNRNNLERNKKEDPNRAIFKIY